MTSDSGRSDSGSDSPSPRAPPRASGLSSPTQLAVEYWQVGKEEQTNKYLDKGTLAHAGPMGWSGSSGLYTSTKFVQSNDQVRELAHIAAPCRHRRGRERERASLLPCRLITHPAAPRAMGQTFTDFWRAYKRPDVTEQLTYGEFLRTEHAQSANIEGHDDEDSPQSVEVCGPPSAPPPLRSSAPPLLRSSASRPLSASVEALLARSAQCGAGRAAAPRSLIHGCAHAPAASMVPLPHGAR